MSYRYHEQVFILHFVYFECLNIILTLPFAKQFWWPNLVQDVCVLEKPVACGFQNPHPKKKKKRITAFDIPFS
ncbi:hypothetical protein QVD17_25754 [Tagetes erecta]|uniref:Uncharacterized protein n=1 Tax=Tagetes erecta TaxID=13708 RepID=A0AAD8K681_TARER|nr:hypothetical protein QVD17_25754 [Tagetes erecta]